MGIVILTLAESPFRKLAPEHCRREDGKVAQSKWFEFPVLTIGNPNGGGGGGMGGSDKDQPLFLAHH